MEEILILSSILKEKIWGGGYFKKINKTTSNNKIGELWSASGHQNGDSIIISGKYEDRTLSDLFLNENHLFNLENNEFPILIKIIDSKEPLSVQVHPNDDYALKNENQYGKTEGWFILDCEEDSTIVLGVNAKNKKELVNYLNENDFKNLLKIIKVKKGQFIPIDFGVIHALGANITLLEVQRSSDVTYRFYDYDRLENGKKRELHLDKAIEVTNFDKQDTNFINNFELSNSVLWDNEYFNIKYFNITSSITFEKPIYFSVVTIIEGSFLLDDLELTIGDSFIITNHYKLKTMYGTGKFVITNPYK